MTQRDRDRVVPPGPVPHGGPAAALPSGPRPTPRARLGAFFGVDDHWVREGSVTRWDALLGLMILVFSTVALELIRSGGVLRDVDRPGWMQWLAVALGAAVLVGRRRWPLTVTSLAALHLVVVTITMPEVAVQVAMQVFYFIAIFSGVAWARSRRDMLVVMGAVVVVMTLWIAWQFAVGSGIDEVRRLLELEGGESFGLMSPIAAFVLYTALVNAAFFGSAIVGGQVAWRSARQRAHLAEQAELLRVHPAGARRGRHPARRRPLARAGPGRPARAGGGQPDRGLATSFELVEDRPGAAERVPRPIALSLYRIGQEALANVRRHSTATRVDVVVRVQGGEAGGYVEIEVVDDGRARNGTSGTGLGQLGIRERAASHRGEVEIGPRPVGGYRVRVRLPLTLVGPLPAGASA